MSDYIRIYDARAVECIKCNEAEEAGIGNSRTDFTLFDYDPDKDHYTCGSCGMQCVRESELREYRDYE